MQRWSAFTTDDASLLVPSSSEDVLEAARKYGAAVPVIPVTDTQELSISGFVERTISRNSLPRPNPRYFAMT